MLRSFKMIGPARLLWGALTRLGEFGVLLQ